MGKNKELWDGTGQAAAKGASLGATIGSAVPVVGTAVGAGLGAGIGIGGKLLQNNRTKKKMDALLKERPTYNINEEAYANQGIAKARAFGRDRTIQMAEENVDRDVASQIGQAKNISSNTGAILDTLASLGTGAQDTKRGLSMDESQLQNMKFGELYAANNALIDEKDKAWNFNTNQPYQNKVQALRDKQKYNQEQMNSALDMAGSLAASGGFTAKSPRTSNASSTFTSKDIRGNGNNWILDLPTNYNENFDRFNTDHG